MNSESSARTRVRPHRTFKQKWALISLPNKLMVISTVAIALATVVNLGVAGAMWREMHSGGVETHNLAAAAKDQATSTHDLAAAARTQADEASKQAAAAKSQSDNTEKLATAASKQVTKLQAGVDQTAKLASAAARANDIAKQAMEAQTRPWIGIEGELRLAKTNLTNDDITIEFDFKLRNYGQSPATKVAYVFSLDPSFKGYTALPYQKSDCSDADQRSSASDPSTSSRLQSIFPGDSGATIIHDSAYLKRNNGALAWYLVGCIAYQGPTGEGTLHHTRVIYAIAYRNGNTQISGLVPGGTVTD
jgi:hypothetical protein